jgi:hypothetical protein
MLQRVLLAYARWNKQVGYCQGFNVIAALILDVMDRQEDSALKVSVDTVTVSLFTTSAYDWRFGRLSVLAVYSSRRTITRFRARGKNALPVQQEQFRLSMLDVGQHRLEASSS